MDVENKINQSFDKSNKVQSEFFKDNSPVSVSVDQKDVDNDYSHKRYIY